MTRNARTISFLLLGLALGAFLPHLMNFVAQTTRLSPCAEDKQTTAYPDDARSFREIRSEIPSGSNSDQQLTKKLKKKKFVFVGIMTAEKFLDTRARAVYDTWGSDLAGYGKLMFFASAQSQRSNNLPIVSLDGVDDTYPPQRKSMMMLKYMHDNYGDEYEWFVRGDDDVYIRVAQLERFLRTLNSSDDLYIGQAGTGTKIEKETLGLGAGNNYCMGGPSVVISASALHKVTPHFEHCLQHLVTNHEDVEVGRCIKNFVGVSCTWAFEMQSLFYHNRSGELAFTQQLDTKAVRNAVTLHPIKQSQYMYRLHSHFIQLKVRKETYTTVQLQRRLKVIDELLKNGLKETSADQLVKMNDPNFQLLMPKDEAPSWEMFTPRKVYSFNTNSPEIGMMSPLKDGLNTVLGQTMSIINREARKVLHRTLEFKRLNHGYLRYHPKYGMQFMLDLLMKYHRHIGRNRRRMTVHVRHHAYLQQPFGNTVYSVEQLKQPPTVNFILPLAGRYTTFVKFMATFEQQILEENEKATLTVVYFHKVSSPHQHKLLFKRIQNKYPKMALRWLEIEGAFSRSLGLTMGAAQHDKNALFFFCDVDLDFNRQFLSRCRSNAKINKQVYYPMVFSQFAPEVAYRGEEAPNTTFTYSKDAGFWREYGFGITCQYKQDFDAIGGFDTTIQGWGMEDVELYDRYVLSVQHEVFRAVDPGLVHIYHEVVCDKQLAEKQLTMCYASKAQAYGSQRKLFEMLQK